MRHILLHFASGISLMLLIATIILWWRSYNHAPPISAHDMINFTHDDPMYWVIAYPGEAVLYRQTGRNWDGHDLPHVHFAGIDFGGSYGPAGDMLWNLRVPFWLLVVCFAALPLIWIRMLRRDQLRRRRERMGCCPRCGYDLRATPGRCPECGLANPIAS